MIRFSYVWSVGMFFCLRMITALLLSLSVFTGTAVASDDVSELALVGFSVNGEEVANIDALQKGQSYYLPVDLFVDSLGIKPNKGSSTWSFHTPLGGREINSPDLITYQQKKYIALTAFKSLGVNAVYNSSQLSINVYVPWDAKNPFPDSPQSKAQKKPIDYYPDTFAVGGVKISGGFNRQTNKASLGESKPKSNASRTGADNFSLDVGAIGYLTGGMWGVDLQYQNSRRTSSVDNAANGFSGSPYVNNLYWQTAQNNWALRLGNNGNTFGLDTNEYTGVTLAYSNTGIQKHLSRPSSTSRQLLRGDSSLSARIISGKGPAGGIAELKVNGKPVSRVRIGLDGEYEFRNLNLGDDTDDYAFEVAIYEYSLLESPVEVYKPFLSNRRSNVGTGELLLEAGYGKENNAFDTRNSRSAQTTHTPLHAYAEYGLHNNVAVRGAVSKNNTTAVSAQSIREYSTMAGANLGLPFGVNMDVSYKQLALRNIYKTSLRYDAKYFGANYHYQKTRFIGGALPTGSDSKNNARKRTEQNLNLRFSPHERFNMSWQGTRNEIDTSKVEQYYTASLYARLHDNVSATINRDKKHDDRYGLYWNIPQWQANASANWDHKSKVFRVGKRITETLSIGASVSQEDNKRDDAYRAYADYRYNDRHKFHIGAGKQGERTSYDVNWQYRPNNYGLVSLGYRRNQSQQERSIATKSPILSESNYFYLQFNFDFIRKKGEGLEFGNYRPSPYGSVVTTLHSTGNDIELDDRIQMKLDDYPVEAYKINSNQYRIDNVKSGVYEMSFPVDNLPLEYQSTALSKPIVKVAKASPTFVDYQLQKTFGISGQLLTEKENVLITVYRGSEKIAETRTGPYGYYQIIGLPTGNYDVRAAGGKKRQVSISDEILFEVDL